jgi:hypothetical protein
VPLFDTSPLIVTEVAAVVALLQVPPLLMVRLAAVIVAAAVLLIAPPLLITTVPKAFAPVLLMESVLLTVVVPLTVNPKVLVAREPVLTLRLVAVTAPPWVTVALELIFRFKSVAVPGVNVWAPVPLMVSEDPPEPVSVIVPKFVMGVAPAIERLTLLVPPPSVKMLVALDRAKVPFKESEVPLARVKVVVVVVRDKVRLFNPPDIAGIVTGVATAPAKVRLLVVPPVSEPELMDIPPSTVSVNAPIVKAPLVNVSAVAPVPVIVVEAVKLTPAPLLIVSELMVALARSLPVDCAALPL